MINLYTDATPNGLKISIALEELALEYTAHRLFLGGDQKMPAFTKMNLNQKIPVLTDGDITISESGAILYYLAEKTGKLLPQDLAKRSKVMELLMLQMSGLGPYFGQLLVWGGAWGNEFPKVTERYQKEVSRLLTVLNQYLRNSEFIAGDEYSIADIAFLPWIRMCFVHPIGEMLPMDAHQNVTAWYERLMQRGGVKRGLLVPEPHPPQEQLKAFVSAVVGLGDLHP
ncbi:MAG: GST-like protein [Oceanospirillaceae bacterium]|jgi:GST-like protein